MYCQRCGKEIQNDANLAAYCGIKVNSVKTENEMQNIKVVGTEKNSSSNKKKIYIFASIIAVVGLILAAFGIIYKINYDKNIKLYQEGLDLVASSNITEAKDKFSQCNGYKESDLYSTILDAADELYNKKNNGNALIVVTDKLNTENNIGNIKKYIDRDSSKLACFIIGDVYFLNNNYNDANSFYSLVPITYKAFNHSVYERKATIALVGKWKGTCQLHDVIGNHADNATVSVELIYKSDGKEISPAHGDINGNSGYIVWYAHEEEVDNWCVDTSFDGTDGAFHYCYTSDSSNKFSILNGILEHTNSHGQAYNYWKLEKVK